jgi:hypothetical protein
VAEEISFPTFCHIGEYDEYGYQILHRMLAVSQPLILWAPTSPQLGSAQCRIPPSSFLRHVEEGRIRVFAREQWLASPKFRDSHPFPGARWVEGFDGVLKKMCQEDASRPLGQRRVVAAPPEEGWQWAENYLADNPTQVSRWNRLAHGKAAASKIPVGTLQAAYKYAGDDSFRLAQAILRDAYNHGQAIRLSGAQAPFWLSPADRTFLRVLRDTADPETPSANRGRSKQPAAASGSLPEHAGSLPEHAPVDETGAEVASQLVSVLRLLDIGSPSLHRGKDLDEFLRGDGRREMVSWLSDTCTRLRATEARNLDRSIVNALRADLDNAGFSKPLREMIKQPAATAVGAVGLVTTVMGYAVDPGGALSIAGLFAAAFPVARELFRSLGYIPADYSGPQWPFLYAYGSPATKRNVARLLNVLSEP